MRRKIFLAVVSFLAGFVLFAQAQERTAIWKCRREISGPPEHCALALVIQPPYQITLNKPLPRDIEIGAEIEVMPPVDPRGAIQFCGKGEAFLRGYREGREVWRKELYRKGKGYRERERYVVE